MKNFGVLLLIIGGIWALIAFNMDTTVSTKGQYIGNIYVPGTTVHNIGKMDERRNHLMMSSLLIVTGVILFAFGNIRQTDSSQSKKMQMLPNPIDDTRKCPYCAEMIRIDAIKCKHCGSDLAQAENLSVPKITLTSKELLQKAYDRYHKSSDLNGTLELYKTIILSDPNSSEADSAKAQVKKILASNELFEKAYNRHYKANDITNALDYYKMVIEIFPDSPDACYAKTQIKNIEALESKVLDPLRGILSIQV